MTTEKQAESKQYLLYTEGHLVAQVVRQPLQVSEQLLRSLFPRAPEDGIIDFVSKHHKAELQALFAFVTAGLEHEGRELSQEIDPKGKALPNWEQCTIETDDGDSFRWLFEPVNIALEDLVDFSKAHDAPAFLEVAISASKAPISMLEDLDENFVAYIEDHDGPLELDGIKTLNARAAEILSMYEGSLILNNLTELSEESAIFLGQHTGHLAMNGLRALSHSVAISLSRHNGSLELKGLKTLSEKDFEAFKAFKYSIILSEAAHSAMAEAWIKKLTLADLNTIKALRASGDGIGSIRAVRKATGMGVDGAKKLISMV